MLRVLARLVNVKSLSELEIDHAALEKSPELKSLFVSFLDRAHEGHTNEVPLGHGLICLTANRLSDCSVSFWQSKRRKSQTCDA